MHNKHIIWKQGFLFPKKQTNNDDWALKPLFSIRAILPCEGPSPWSHEPEHKPTRVAQNRIQRNRKHNNLRETKGRRGPHKATDDLTENYSFMFNTISTSAHFHANFKLFQCQMLRTLILALPKAF